MGVGRYRLPNLIHKIGRLLIAFAVFLKKVSDTKKPEPNFDRFCVLSVATACSFLNQKITFFDKNQSIALQKPRVINSDIHLPDAYACTAKLPDTYIAELDNILVFGGTELMVAQNKYVLYDEIGEKFSEFYPHGIKSPMIRTKDKQFIRLQPFLPEKFLTDGIHFTKDHSCNYFHWLIECLPRLSLIEKMPPLEGVPLIVDRDLPPQYFEALDILNKQRRKIIKIGSKEACFVKKLYYPSPLSILHDNYFSPVRYDEDFIVSSNALSFTRNAFREACGVMNQKGRRKLFVARESSVRKLLNTSKIMEVLLSNGFEVVFPEKLSFVSQVNLFSQAAIVVGQSGAGMANVLFVPEDCKIIVLAGNALNTNLHIFNGIASSLSMNMVFMIGEPQARQKKVPIHANFSIDIDLLKSYIQTHA